MTPTRRRECLTLLRWTQRGFADAIGWDESTVRRWMRDGGEAPPSIDAWLKKLAAFHAAHPPPREAHPRAVSEARPGAPMRQS